MNSEELIEQITYIAKDVYETLGPGYLEGVYEKAMMVGLRLQKIPYESQRQLPVAYRGHFVGELIPDLLVGDQSTGQQRVIIELKRHEGTGIALTQAQQQLKRYMKSLEIDHGLLINFFTVEDEVTPPEETSDPGEGRKRRKRVSKSTGRPAIERFTRCVQCGNGFPFDQFVKSGCLRCSAG